MWMGDDIEITDSRLVRKGDNWLWEVFLDDMTLGARVEFSSYWTDYNWPYGICVSMGYDPHSGNFVKSANAPRGCMGFIARLFAFHGKSSVSKGHY